MGNEVLKKLDSQERWYAASFGTFSHELVSYFREKNLFRDYKIQSHEFQKAKVMDCISQFENKAKFVDVEQIHQGLGNGHYC